MHREPAFGISHSLNCRNTNSTCPKNLEQVILNLAPVGLFLIELGSCLDYLEDSVLTQRDSIRKLILQVKDLAKSLQKLQNHQGLAKELWRQSGPHRDRAGQILEDTHEEHQVAVDECGHRWVEACKPSGLHTPYLLWVCSTVSVVQRTSSSPPSASLVPANRSPNISNDC